MSIEWPIAEWETDAANFAVIALAAHASTLMASRVDLSEHRDKIEAAREYLNDTLARIDGRKAT